MKLCPEFLSVDSDFVENRGPGATPASALNETTNILKKRFQVEYSEKEFSEPSTGVEAMTIQIPVGRSNHWALGVSQIINH